MLKTLHQSIKVLNLFVAKDQSFSTKDVAAKLDMPSLNVYRILETFVANQYLEKNEETKQYSIGPALAPLILVAEQKYNVVSLIQPCLLKLMQATEEAVYLVRYTGDQSAENIDAFTPKNKASFAVSLLEPNTLYSGASYWAILAFLPDELCQQVLATPFENLLHPDIVTPAFLRQELAVIRQNRVAISYEVTTPEMIAISAPVFSEEQILGSVTVAIPTSRATERSIDTLAAQVKETAELITTTLSTVKLNLSSYHLFNSNTQA